MCGLNPRRDAAVTLFTEQQGYTLVVILLWLMVIVTLLTGMVYAAELSLDFSQREVVSGKCYAMSKEIAESIVDGLATQHQPLPNVQESLAGMEVHVQAVEKSGAYTVSVETVSINVADTITFTYDTISHRILTWQDNGPGLVE